MSAEEKLQAIVEMVDNWNEQFGVGTRVAEVMGRQTVSIEYLHERIHEIADN